MTSLNRQYLQFFQKILKKQEPNLYQDNFLEKRLTRFYIFAFLRGVETVEMSLCWLIFSQKQNTTRWKNFMYKNDRLLVIGIIILLSLFLLNKIDIQEVKIFLFFLIIVRIISYVIKYSLKLMQQAIQWSNSINEFSMFPEFYEDQAKQFIKECNIKTLDTLINIEEDLKNLSVIQDSKSKTVDEAAYITAFVSLGLLVLENNVFIRFIQSIPKFLLVFGFFFYATKLYLKRLQQNKQIAYQKCLYLISKAKQILERQ